MSYPLFAALWSLDASDQYFLNASTSIASAMNHHKNSIQYVIATPKPLTPFQQHVTKQITKRFGESIQILSLPKVSMFKKYSHCWKPIIFAKVMLGHFFKIPYMAVDADVMFLDKIGNIDFLTSEKPIMSVADVVQLKRNHHIKLSEAFNVNADVYLNAGSLFVLPDTINPAEVFDFLEKHGNNKAIIFPEQDMLAVMKAGKLAYLPSELGVQCYTGTKIKWMLQIKQDILNGKYKFAHLMDKQWKESSILYDLHLHYLKEMNLPVIV